jgi:hypothetical protein
LIFEGKLDEENQSIKYCDTSLYLRKRANEDYLFSYVLKSTHPELGHYTYVEENKNEHSYVLPRNVPSWIQIQIFFSENFWLKRSSLTRGIQRCKIHRRKLLNNGAMAV